MSIWNYFAVMLILTGMMLPVSSQQQVSLTVYVHEGSLNSTLLSDVLVSGQDADGNEFSEMTDSNGMAVIQGIPGTWQFAFQKAGYDPLYLNYNAAQSEEVAAYLEKNETKDLINLNIYVHDSNLSGDLLPGVEVKGQDGNGNAFAETADANGMAVVRGEPGIWQFAFQKDGYDILILKYNATQTEDTAAYLMKAV
jgi:predicted alpha/beta hydrolase